MQPLRCRRAQLVGSFWIATWLLTGCASQDVYQASQLPAQWQAPHIENAQTLDLSKLSTGAYNNEQIDTGDILEVQIVVGLNAKDNPPVLHPRVNEAGSISLPNVGDVYVRGLDLETAESAIASACIQRQIYRSPLVTVSMRKQRTNRIMVVGGVKQQNTYNLPRGNSNLLSAIVAAGGLSEDAGTEVEVRIPAGANDGLSPDPIARDMNRAGLINQAGHTHSPASTRSAPSSFRVDLISATKGGQATAPLPDGAIVYVQRRDPEAVQVIGLVHKPGEIKYPIGSDLRLLGAISQAGGVSNRGANKVYIIRNLPGQPAPILIEASIRAAKQNGSDNLRLAPGDVVSVEQTPMTALVDAIMLIRFGIGASLGTIF
jgi:polysaccharide export outer membrane protein